MREPGANDELLSLIIVSKKFPFKDASNITAIKHTER